MRNFVVTVLVVAILGIGAAVAADLPVKAPIYSPAPVYNWSGFYIGVNVGYAFGTSDWQDTRNGAGTGDFNVDGGLAGGTVGYNRETGSWVLGLEGDFDASAIKGSTTVHCPVCTISNTWLATGRGRIGYAWDRFLPYITGGAAFGNIMMAPPPQPHSGALLVDSQTKVGWIVGAGVEYAFMGAWSAKAEYLYANLGTATCNLICSNDQSANTTHKFSTGIVRLGVNYRL